MFHSPLRPIAWEDKSGEKGAPVAGGVPYYPQKRHPSSSRALGRGMQLSILTEQLPSTKEQALPNTAQSHEHRQNLLPYVVKKAAASPASPHKVFSFGG